LKVRRKGKIKEEISGPLLLFSLNKIPIRLRFSPLFDWDLVEGASDEKRGERGGPGLAFLFLPLSPPLSTT